MNDNELKYLKWLENKKKRDNLLSVTYSTTDGDTSSEDFFAEANAMNDAETIEVTDYSENFPRYLILDLFKAGDDAITKAIAEEKAEEFEFNDKTTKK